jgi:hypothetical protein
MCGLRPHSERNPAVKRVDIQRFALGVLLLLLLQSLGCLGTRGGKLPPIEAWPPAKSDSAQPISLEITGFSEWTPASGRRLRGPVSRGSIVRAFSDSGLFSSVSDALVPGNLRAKVQIEARETLKGNGWLTALTLYLVPFGRIHTYDLQMGFIDPEGDVIFICQRTDTSSLWWHLVFVFTWPFNRPLSVAPTVRYDLARACLVEAATTGVL